MDRPAVELTDAVAVLGSFPALAGASLVVQQGEIVLLRGPNGAGKTTLLRVCAGLLPLARGTGIVLGCDLATERDAVRRRVGLLGHRNGGVGVYEGSNKFLIADAPKSPLWQQKFGGEEVEPCRGVEDPGGRDGLGEETVEEKTGVPVRLRRGASHLEKAIDDCSDWEKPATSGIFMLVCNEDELDAYVVSGLEDPGAKGVRIEALDSGEAESGPVEMPAVRRNRSGTYLDDWQITAAQPLEASVYASCPSGDKVVVARFEDVPIVQGAELTIDDKGPGGAWVLTESNGAPVSEAVPFTTKAKDGLLVEKAPVPGTYLPCAKKG